MLSWPEKMSLIFLRHGETDWNAQEVHQSLHSGLNTHGKEQVRHISESLINFKIKSVWASMAIRTKQTAYLLKSSLGIDSRVTATSLLDGVRRPSEVINRPKNDPDVLRTIAEANANFGTSTRFSDEETFYEALDRADSVIRLGREVQDHDYDALFVSHGSLIKLVLARIQYGTSLTPQILQEFWQEKELINTAVVSIDNYALQEPHLGLATKYFISSIIVSSPNNITAPTY